MSRDLNTDDRIKRAAQEALDTKRRPAALLSTAMSAWDASA